MQGTKACRTDLSTNINMLPAPTRQPLRLLDGGTGHELKRRGFGDDPSFSHSFMAGLLANKKKPELVISVHTDYLLAGADIITTNNFVCVEVNDGAIKLPQTTT